MLMLPPPYLCTGVLWNVAILVRAWKSCLPQLTCQVVHHLVVMLSALPSQRCRARRPVMSLSVELQPTTAHSACSFRHGGWCQVEGQWQAYMHSDERPPECVSLEAFGGKIVPSDFLHDQLQLGGAVDLKVMCIAIIKGLRYITNVIAL
jgi:hypothetical protein